MESDSVCIIFFYFFCTYKKSKQVRKKKKIQNQINGGSFLIQKKHICSLLKIHCPKNTSLLVLLFRENTLCSESTLFQYPGRVGQEIRTNGGGRTEILESYNMGTMYLQSSATHYNVHTCTALQCSAPHDTDKPQYPLLQGCHPGIREGIFVPSCVYYTLN